MRNFGLRPRRMDDFDFSHPVDGPLSGFWLVPSLLAIALFAGVATWWLG